MCVREREDVYVLCSEKPPKETSSEEEEGENQHVDGEARPRDAAGCLL